MLHTFWPLVGPNALILELIPDAAHGWMLPVLDLDPACIGRHDRRDLAASRQSLPVPRAFARPIRRSGA